MSVIVQLLFFSSASCSAFFLRLRQGPLRRRQQTSTDVAMTAPRRYPTSIMGSPGFFQAQTAVSRLHIKVRAFTVYLVRESARIRQEIEPNRGKT